MCSFVNDPDQGQGWVSCEEVEDVLGSVSFLSLRPLVEESTFEKPEAA